jgi:hypothetical protein
LNIGIFKANSDPNVKNTQETGLFSFRPEKLSNPDLKPIFQIENGYWVENGSAVPARPYSGSKNGSSSHHLIASEM